MAQRVEKDTEVWKRIKGLPEYSISNFARIKNHVTGKPVNPSIHKKKMCHIFGIRYKGKNHVYALHRIVADYFVPNPEKYKYVTHIDKNKHNNRADNLKWVEFVERGRQNSLITEEQESEIMEKLKHGVTGAELALQYNTSEMSISRINKKLLRKLSEQVKKSGVKVILPETRTKTPIDKISDIDWFSFIINNLKKEKALLATYLVIDLATQKYGFEGFSKHSVSNQINIIFKKLALLSIVKRINVTNKQRLFYGLAEWFDKQDNLLPEFEKPIDQSIEAKLNRSSKHKNFEIMQNIVNIFLNEGKVLTINELYSEYKKKEKISKKDNENLKNKIILVLNEMVNRTILNRMEADENDYWYGISDWWYTNSTKLKHKYTGLN